LKPKGDEPIRQALIRRISNRELKPNLPPRHRAIGKLGSISNRELKLKHNFQYHVLAGHDYRISNRELKPLSQPFRPPPQPQQAPRISNRELKLSKSLCLTGCFTGRASQIEN